MSLSYSGSGEYMLRGQVLSCLKARKIISKGCTYNPVRLRDVESETSSLELVLIMKEFLKVFLNDLPSLLPKRDIDFDIDLLPDT